MATSEDKRSSELPWLEAYCGDHIDLARTIQQAFTEGSDQSDPVDNLARQLKTAGYLQDLNYGVLDFLNSKAVRDHLKGIGYRFTAVEAAFIVYQSRAKSTVEKLCAWTRILDELPDCNDGIMQSSRLLKGPVYDFQTAGIHEILREYIPMVISSLDSFFSGETSYYYQSYIQSSTGELWSEWDQAYPSADLCIASALEDGDEEGILLTVRKGYLYEEKRRFDEVEFRNNTLVSADVFSSASGRIEDLNIFFDSLWLPIPCPFKKGDIVYDPAIDISSSSFCNRVMVVTGSSYERFLDTQKRGTDTSDMYLAGYFQGKDGAIYHEVTYSYLDMEYASSEMLVGKSRVLLALSKLLRDEIDVSLFSDVMLHVIFDELAQRYSISEGWWLAETLESLGFPQKPTHRHS